MKNPTRSVQQRFSKMTVTLLGTLALAGMTTGSALVSTNPQSKKAEKQTTNQPGEIGNMSVLSDLLTRWRTIPLTTCQIIDLNPLKPAKGTDVHHHLNRR
jgi:hypothetical protein